MDLTGAQSDVARAPLDAKLFLSGPAGAGKTTAAVARLRHLLDRGIPADSVLLLTPQRFLHEPYLQSLEQDPYAGGQVTATTMGGLARRMVELFWPVAADATGFATPDQPPVFLNLETAQYYMAHIVRPLLDQGYFESVTIDRNRLYSQILDNLNKAAIIGFPYTEIAARLDSAIPGLPAQRRVYQDAQECAGLFREYCLQHNLLDFSLQMEIFANVLWPREDVRSHLHRAYRHLVYDNVEEDGPRAHDMIREWLGDLDSALLVYDEGGGLRFLLGADPVTGWALRELCTDQTVLTGSFVMSPAIAALSDNLAAAIAPEEVAPPLEPAADYGDALQLIQTRFYPELLDVLTSQIQRLIADDGLPASEIAILAPFVSDSLRFSITNRLETLGIPWRSHRPSRSLRDEPSAHALLTLAALGHPAWDVHPPKSDLAYAFMQSIEGLDLVRAQILAEIVYRPRDLTLTSFDAIKPDMQERITFSVGLRYSMLRDWLLAYREEQSLPFDHFLRRLFGEVLSQPGFGFRSRLDAIRVAASLIESIKRFRQATESTQADFPNLGTQYINMLQDGVIAAQYIETWQIPDVNAVLVAPAYTFLMM
ncbi:MAG TPA: hypothetical protein VIU39_01805, partial [Anaerolineales bacterium]